MRSVGLRVLVRFRQHTPVAVDALDYLDRGRAAAGVGQFDALRRLDNLVARALAAHLDGGAPRGDVEGASQSRIDRLAHRRVGHLCLAEEYRRAGGVAMDAQDAGGQQLARAAGGDIDE